MDNGNRPEGRVSRRKFILLAVGAGSIVLATAFLKDQLFRAPASTTPVTGGSEGQVGAFRPPERTLGSEEETSLDQIYRGLISGGPPKDGIPAIRNPKYIPRDEADRVLRDGDVVFGVDYGGVAKAFPQNILNWHEVVSDRIGGTTLNITFCPLTGSAVGYIGKSRDNDEDLSFGVSGSLYNSNLVMYDHQSDGRWPQILGVGLNGPNKGNTLSEFPIAHTTWGRWKRRYPNTLVLSQDTGHLRNYGLNPYEGYETSSQVWFPLAARSDRYHPKKVVTGVKLNGGDLAIPKQEMARRKVGNTSLRGVPITIFYDQDLDIVRVFARRLEGRDLSFQSKDGKILDKETSSTWTGEGKATEGQLTGSQLQLVNSFDLMWLAWYAFYPNTEVFE